MGPRTQERFGTPRYFFGNGGMWSQAEHLQGPGGGTGSKLKIQSRT